MRPIGWWLKEAHERLDAAFDTALDGTGIDRRAWQVLATLAGDAPARTEDDLAAALAPFERADGVRRRIAALQADGLVAADGDGVRLTEAGRAAHTQIAPLVGAVREQVGAALGDDYPVLVGLLGRLVEALPSR
jgi:hypothetical protein